MNKNPSFRVPIPIPIGTGRGNLPNYKTVTIRRLPAFAVAGSRRQATPQLVGVRPPAKVLNGGQAMTRAFWDTSGKRIIFNPPSERPHQIPQRYPPVLVYV